MTGPNDPDQPLADDLMRRTLEERGEFELVLIDGERWVCRLVEYSPDALVVRAGEIRYLVPVHAIKYIVLDEDAGRHLIALAANEVQALHEFLISGGERERRSPA